MLRQNDGKKEIENQENIFDKLPDHIFSVELLKFFSSQEKFALRLVSKRFRKMARESYLKYRFDYEDVITFLSETKSMKKIQLFLSKYRQSDAYKIHLKKFSEKQTLKAEEIILFALTREADHTQYLSAGLISDVLTKQIDLPASIRSALEILTLALQAKGNLEIENRMCDKLSSRETSYVNLSGIDLSNMCLMNTNFSLVDATKANVSQSNFSNANLDDACLINAKFDFTRFIHSDTSLLHLFSFHSFNEVTIFKETLDRYWVSLQQNIYNGDPQKDYITTIADAIIRLSQVQDESIKARLAILNAAIKHPMFRSDETLAKRGKNNFLHLFKKPELKFYPVNEALEKLKQARHDLKHSPKNKKKL